MLAGGRENDGTGDAAVSSRWIFPEGCTWMRSRECENSTANSARRDSMHRHRFLLAPRCTCTSISDVLSEADVEGGESCDISIRGCPKGRVPEVDPPLPRPDESNFNNDHCDHVIPASSGGQFVTGSLSTQISQWVSQSHGCLRGYRKSPNSHRFTLIVSR